MQERGQVKGSLEPAWPTQIPRAWAVSYTRTFYFLSSMKAANCSSSWGLQSPTLNNPTSALGVFGVATNLMGSLSTYLKPGSSLSPPQHP